MRSVVVVLPASMCAMIPIFRQRFRGIVRATVFLSHLQALACGRTSVQTLKQGEGDYTLPPAPYTLLLPAVVRESLVGLSHAMNVFLLLHRGATAIGGIQQLGGQLVDHALLATGA